MQGKLFIFEGPNGVGKTTIVSALKERLSEQDGRYEFLSFPGKDIGTLGRVIYDIHHDPEKFGIAAMSELAKQTLHIAAHIDAIETRIRPYLDSGGNIVLDRFWWSTLVYGIVGGVELSGLNQLIAAEKVVWANLRPSIAFLVDRDRPINRLDKFDAWLRLRSSYAQLAADERANHDVVVLENVGAIDDAVDRALSLIEKAVS